jgi:hypothetical protein
MKKKSKRLTKKILFILLFTVFIVCIAGFIYSYVSFNYYSPGDGEIKADPSELKYFQNSYKECRKEFILSANEIKNIFKNVEIFNIQVESEIDTDLTIDFCYIPAQKEKNKLLIISSGVHGVEGFVGSAVQQMFMTEFLKEKYVNDIGILLIHGVNPYGFKYLRRVTENNVDLNRNCDIDKNLFSIKNSGYTELHKMINPKGKVNTGSLGNRLFYIAMIKKLVSVSTKAFRQAILQGQYEFPKGIFFGGNDFEPQIYAIKSALQEKSENYHTIFHIDLHTGYGERGKLHLFSVQTKDSKSQSIIESLFSGYTIDWGNTDDFYTVTGDFSHFIGKLSPDTLFLSMPFEYGTMNSHTTMGAIKSLQNMIVETQGFYYGYASIEDEKKVKENFIEMFYPSSGAWRSEVMKKTREMMDVVMQRYKDL